MDRRDEEFMAEALFEAQRSLDVGEFHAEVRALSAWPPQCRSSLGESCSRPTRRWTEARAFRASGRRVNGKKYDQTSYAVYQRLGNVLAGAYSVSVGPNTPAQRRLLLHSAEQSAKNLIHGNNVGTPTA